MVPSALRVVLQPLSTQTDEQQACTFQPVFPTLFFLLLVFIVSCRHHHPDRVNLSEQMTAAVIFPPVKQSPGEDEEENPFPVQVCRGFLPTLESGVWFAY